jgi:putative oxidoreductase
MLGAATRLAVIPLIINMSVIVFVVHADDPWQRQEFALLFLIPFLTLLFTGPGHFSIDGLIRWRTPELDRRG